MTTRKQWLDDEVEYVRNNWQSKTNAEIANDLGVTKCQVEKLRHKLGLKHPTSPRKSKEFHSTHGSYEAMIHRCYYEKNPSYANYGGRGIEICDRWRGVNGWANFLEDMGEKPHRDLKLDRIDNAIGYEPNNCRWVTAEESANNRTNSRWIFAFGEWKTISQWVRDERCKVSAGCLRHRLDWNLDADPEDVLSGKICNYQAPSYEAFGESKSINKWCNDSRCKCSYTCLRNRLVRFGWDIEKAIVTPALNKGRKAG